MHKPARSDDCLIGINCITEMLQRSRASIYRDISDGRFPRPLKLGASSRWKLSEVEAVIERLSLER